MNDRGQWTLEASAAFQWYAFGHFFFSSGNFHSRCWSIRFLLGYSSTMYSHSLSLCLSLPSRFVLIIFVPASLTLDLSGGMPLLTVVDTLLFCYFLCSKIPYICGFLELRRLKMLRYSAIYASVLKTIYVLPDRYRRSDFVRNECTCYQISISAGNI